MIVADGSHPTGLEDAIGDESARSRRVRGMHPIATRRGDRAFSGPGEAHFASGASFSLAGTASFSLAAAAAGTLALRTVVMSVTATGLRL